MLTSIKTNHFGGDKGKEIGMRLIAAIQFIYPSFLFEVFDFSVARMVHINALVVWML